jgi:hypothetical protein
MRNPNRVRLLSVSVLFAASVFGPFSLPRARAAGVTIITHGFYSDANGWVAAMAGEITNYYRFPGTNFTIYKVTLTTDGSNYYYQWQRDNGSAPSTTDSGEIMVKLDWSQMAGGPSDAVNPFNDDTSTSNVAWIAAYVVSQTNAIADLNGHALAEFPIHLIGHSRGGSLVNELSRQLGTNGIWVDHLTTLDPHPLNNDGNSEFGFFPTDASASNTYENVLFRDNYWQNYPGGFLDFNGESVLGAYDRHLTDQETSGGYSGASAHHSNVHLWYHGTIDGDTPANDSGASITDAERQTWWTSYEGRGVFAGFYHSLLGGGDRLSTDQPVGPGFGMVRDGYNQRWDFGAGVADNRTSLPTNNGNWPNLIKVNLTTTNVIAFGQDSAFKFYYQWGQPTTSNATVSFYLDDDFNPNDGNEQFLAQETVAGTTASQVNMGTLSLNLNATNATPGFHTLYAKITGGDRTRYLYAPETLKVFSSFEPPGLAITIEAGTGPRVDVAGVPGQSVVLQSSTNFQNWQPLATNWLGSNIWSYFDTQPPVDRRFYRAILQ